MALTAAQNFLVHACHVAGMNDYFRWVWVGRALGLTEPESASAVKALEQQKLVRLLADGEARLLVGGRQLAARLEAKRRSER